MTARWQIRGDGLHARTLDGELVVLDARAAAYLGGNEAAALLWPALTRGATRAELARLLVSRFDLDPVAAARDVDAFVADLRARQLLAEN